MVSFKTLLALKALLLGVSAFDFAGYTGQITGRTAVVRNAGNSHMHVWWEYGPHGRRRMDLLLGPGQSTTVANLPSGINAVRGYSGCHPGTSQCASLPAVATKLEFTLDGNTGDVINTSLVDGYNIGINVKFQGSNCREMNTVVPREVVQKHCPPQQLIQIPGADRQVHLSCQSDCKFWEQRYGVAQAAHKCCTGPYTRGICQPSNQHFAPWVKHGVGAYLWSLDDAYQSMQTCRLGPLTEITLGQPR